MHSPSPNRAVIESIGSLVSGLWSEYKNKKIYNEFYYPNAKKNNIYCEFANPNTKNNKKNHEFEHSNAKTIVFIMIFDILMQKQEDLQAKVPR